MSKPRKPRLTPAQVRFMKEHVPAYMAWLQATGDSVGIKMQPWQRRTIEALIRKDMITPLGHVTRVGRDALVRQKIMGNHADLIIMDDVKTIV